MAVNSATIRRYVLERQLLTPVLDLDRQLGPGGAFDVRLGHQLIVFNRVTGFRTIDPTEGPQLEEELEKHHQSVIRLGYGEKFHLHPGDFIIARTFEYLNMPEDWLGYVAGRSSWGRVGLVIATATFVNPGFKGTITLEIANLGQVPVALIPLTRIAQLVFHPMAPHEEKV